MNVDNKLIRYLTQAANGMPVMDFKTIGEHMDVGRIIASLQTEQWDGDEPEEEQAAQVALFTAGIVEVLRKGDGWVAQWRMPNRAWKVYRSINRLSDGLDLFTLVVIRADDLRRFTSAWRLDQIQLGTSPRFKVSELEQAGITFGELEDALWKLGWKN